MIASAEERSQSSRTWSAPDFNYPQQGQQVWSELVYPLASSHARTSDNNIYAGLHNRFSTGSTYSPSSRISSHVRNHHLSHTERLLSGNPSPFTSHAPSPAEPTPPPTPKSATSRTSAPAKDPYKTCVSHSQRARRTETEEKYFCTICKEHFKQKYDWKRHEETYQERFDEFACDLCNIKYFLEKDFVKHHVAHHRCDRCRERTRHALKKHVQYSRQPRSKRSGWGCGFCVYFCSDWTKRCDHIANHFEVERKKMEDWDHSRVIYSLLQRPDIVQAWDAIVRSKGPSSITYEWDPTTTGRVEGYPGTL